MRLSRFFHIRKKTYQAFSKKGQIWVWKGYEKILKILKFPNIFYSKFEPNMFGLPYWVKYYKKLSKENIDCMINYTEFHVWVVLTICSSI
jgi:hypothetical protein